MSYVIGHLNQSNGPNMLRFTTQCLETHGYWNCCKTLSGHSSGWCKKKIYITFEFLSGCPLDMCQYVKKNMCAEISVNLKNKLGAAVEVRISWLVKIMNSNNILFVERTISNVQVLCKLIWLTMFLEHTWSENNLSL